MNVSTKKQTLHYTLVTVAAIITAVVLFLAISGHGRHLIAAALPAPSNDPTQTMFYDPNDGPDIAYDPDKCTCPYCCKS